MAKKGPMLAFETVDDYIYSQPDKAQVVLRELRSIIKEAVPEVVEMQNKKVPSFTLIANVKPELQLMIAAYANYVSFYPFDATILNFKNELKNFELGKGTVKFSFNKPLPKDLIIRMVKFRKEEILSNIK